MKSHAILRTNVGLTTNAKIIVTSNYDLYVDSIISNPKLASSKYKKLEFNKNSYWDEILPYFFKDTPTDLAFSIKDDNDSDVMSSNFEKQYDNLYNYGARNIVENKDYTEEFEYFAPIYISKCNLPKNFIIFRVDGPGIINLNKDNFREEIINKLKCVEVFDLTRKTPIGEWLDKNFSRNDQFPLSPFYMDFRKLEFSYWSGIDYEDGGYSEKSLMFDDILNEEQLYHDFEKIIFNGYKSNKVIFPNILNLSFLFDDTPATPSSLRKWSINRYMGFYLDDLELVNNVSPYRPPSIKKDVVIQDNNILFSPTGSPFSEAWKREDFPYLEIEGNFYKIEEFFEEQPSTLERVQISKTSYEEKITNPLLRKYKLISNLDLSGKESLINKRLITIESENSNNILRFLDGQSFEISNYEDYDIWLIEINGIYHNIIKVGDDYFINTDYAFSQSDNKFSYYINDPDPKFRTNIDLILNTDKEPVKFGLYRCKFTDIKDFDTRIVDTEYSKFEYIEKDNLSKTDETKLYLTDQNSTSVPKNLDDFNINGVVVNIPTSSEYTANFETFRIVNNDLSTIWKKNPVAVKWGFQNSISSNDYPYLLNNSFLSEDFNRTCNTFDPKPNRQERNLDYFLTINPDGGVYEHHSLHLMDGEVITYNFFDVSGNIYQIKNVSNIGYFNIGDRILIGDNIEVYILEIDYSKKKIKFSSDVSVPISGEIKNLSSSPFNLDRYLNVGYDYDYFKYLFGKRLKFGSNTFTNRTKWSIFNSGDNVIPNITLFRGINFKIWDVDSLDISDGNINNINVVSRNTYDCYKFSILASKNNSRVELDESGSFFTYKSNGLFWKVIDVWKNDKIYKEGDIVNYLDTLYICNVDSQIIDPNLNPSNSTDWSIYSEYSIYWSPLKNGTNATSQNNMEQIGIELINQTIPPLVYNNNEYYFSSGDVGNNFWDPEFSYTKNDVVLFKGKKWISDVDNNFNKLPNFNSDYWSISNESVVIWKEVELWQREKTYSSLNTSWNTSVGFPSGHYVVYNDIVYLTIGNPNRGIEPTLDSSWLRVYSLVQDTEFIYDSSFDKLENPIVIFNNRIHLCVDNLSTSSVKTNPINLKGSIEFVEDDKSTLENGIDIYVNKKWKNVLVNIYVNDNTYSDSIQIDNDFVINKDYLSNTNRDDIYNDLYSKMSALNIIQSINDLENKYGFSDNIRYIIVNEDLTLDVYDFNDLNTVSNLPVLLTCDFPDKFLTKILSNKYTPINLSENEIRSNRKLDSGNIKTLEEINYYNDINLGVSIEKIKEDPIILPNFSGLVNKTYNILYRHSGFYSPIFTEIELFKRSTLTQSVDNQKFDTDLTNFGISRERVITKVNRKDNILKLKNNSNLKSIYPMLDEYGYFIDDFFIFKSTWDIEYHVECFGVSQRVTISSNQSLIVQNEDNNTNNNNLMQL